MKEDKDTNSEDAQLQAISDALSAPAASHVADQAVANHLAQKRIEGRTPFWFAALCGCIATWLAYVYSGVWYVLIIAFGVGVFAAHLINTIRFFIRHKRISAHDSKAI